MNFSIPSQLDDEGNKENNDYNFLRQASERFIRSVRRAKGSLSWSFSFVPKSEEESLSKNQKRPRSVALGEDFPIFEISSYFGKVCNLVYLEMCL
jgi:hypothetical protein